DDAARRADVREDGRCVEPSGAGVEALAAGEQPRAVLRRARDLILDARPRLLRDHRPEIRVGIHSVADPERLGVRDESIDELARDRLDAGDPFRGGADLAVVEGAGPRPPLYPHLQL